MAKNKTAKSTKRKTASNAPAAVIELGDRRELFVDDYSLRLRFTLSDADLYSLQFTALPG